MGEPILPEACCDCAHFLGAFTPIDGEEQLMCTAFAGAIPDDIVEGRHDHRTPYDGDNGIQYEPFRLEE